VHTMEKLEAFKEQMDWAWAPIARGIGISTAAIHGLRSDYQGKKEYEGDKPGNYRKIEDWLLLQQQRRDAPSPIQFVETSISKKIWTTLDFGLVNRKMVSITGLAGREKTASVTEWALRNDNAILIDTFGSCNNVVFLSDLARILKIDANMCAGRIVKNATTKLYGSERFLIVDNAHNLQFKTMDNLRYIHEQANIGIALVGTPLLLNQMIEQKSLIWEQIYSRLAMRTEVGDLKPEDTKVIVLSVASNASDANIERAHEYVGGSTRELVNYLQRLRTSDTKKKTVRKGEIDFSSIITAAPMKHEPDLEMVDA